VSIRINPLCYASCDEESYYNVSKLAAIENDRKLYTIVPRRGVTYRVYVRSKCRMTMAGNKTLSFDLIQHGIHLLPDCFQHLETFKRRCYSDCLPSRLQERTFSRRVLSAAPPHNRIFYIRLPSRESHIRVARSLANTRFPSGINAQMFHQFLEREDKRTRSHIRPETFLRSSRQRVIIR